MEIDEPFAIDYQGSSLLIVPLEDGTFDVYEGDGRLKCNIFADIGIDTEPSWSSGELLPQDVVNEIGYLIEMKQM